MMALLPLLGALCLAPPPASTGPRLVSQPGDEVLCPRLDASRGELSFEVAGDGARSVQVFNLQKGKATAVPTPARASRDHVFVPRSQKAVLNLLDADGRWSITIGGREPSSPSAASDIEADVTPDGRFVAFVSGRTGRGDVYVAETARQNQSPRRITQDPLPDLAPRWSPDGRRLAVLRVTSQGRQLVVLTGVDAGGAVEEHPACDERDGPLAMSWRPDGKALAFYGQDWGVGTSLFLSDGGDAGLTQKLVTGVRPQRAGPAWLPDGTGGWLAVVVRLDDVIVGVNAAGEATPLATRAFGHGDLACGVVAGKRMLAFTALGLLGGETMDVRHRKLYLEVLP